MVEHYESSLLIKSIRAATAFVSGGVGGASIKGSQHLAELYG